MLRVSFIFLLLCCVEFYVGMVSCGAACTYVSSLCAACMAKHVSQATVTVPPPSLACTIPYLVPTYILTVCTYAHLSAYISREYLGT